MGLALARRMKGVIDGDRIARGERELDCDVEKRFGSGDGPLFHVGPCRIAITRARRHLVEIMTRCSVVCR